MTGPIVPAWGPWMLSIEDLLLINTEEFAGTGQERPGVTWSVYYEVDLERCRTSAEVLDWIGQIAGKSWATPEVIGSLVEALDACLDVQATLCSLGRERGPITVTRESVRARVIQDKAGREASRRLSEGIHSASEVLRAIDEERARAAERFGWA